MPLVRIGYAVFAGQPSRRRLPVLAAPEASRPVSLAGAERLEISPTPCRGWSLCPESGRGSLSIARGRRGELGAGGRHGEGMRTHRYQIIINDGLGEAGREALRLPDLWQRSL